MAPFFLVWASYFLLLAIRKSENKKLLYVFLISAVGGLFYGLGFHSYIAYRATPLIFLALVPFFYKKKVFYEIAGIFLLFTIIAFSPLGIYFLHNPADFFGRTTQISVFDSVSPIKAIAVNTLKTVGMFFVAGDHNWRHNLSGRPELIWPVAILFLVGGIIGIKQLFKKWRRKRQSYPLAYSFLLLWLVVAALPVIISNEGIPHALRATLMIPPVFILAGAGGIALYNYIVEKTSYKYILNTAVALFLIALPLIAYNTYFVKWAKNPNTAGAFTENYTNIAKELNSIPKTTPKVVVVEAGGVLVRGIPMPAQTVMFLTDSFTKAGQARNNISYLTGDEFKTSQIPKSSFVVTIR